MTESTNEPAGQKIIASAVQEAEENPKKGDDIEGEWNVNWEHGGDHQHSS